MGMNGGKMLCKLVAEPKKYKRAKTQDVGIVTRKSGRNRVPNKWYAKWYYKN